MATCIFCPKIIDYSTKPEHIFLNSLGGKKTARWVVCSDCNNRFGCGIDKILAEQFSEIRNFLQVRSGSDEPPPILKRLESGKETIDILPDGKVRGNKKPFSISHLEDDKKTVQISGESLEKINAMIPNIAAILKVPIEQLRQIFINAAGQVTEKRPAKINLQFEFGGPEAIRSIAKSCLVLWATLVGTNEIKTTCFEDARNFINGRENDFLQQRTLSDPRILPNTDKIIEEYGPFFSVIYVKSNLDGRVAAHCTIYNVISFSIILAESGGSPNRQIALILNPLTGQWSDKISDQWNIDFDWLNCPDSDESMQRLSERLSAVLEYSNKIRMEREQLRIIEDVLFNNQFEVGDENSLEKTNKISNEISVRVVHHFLSLPYSASISSDQMMSIFSKNPQTPASK